MGKDRRGWIVEREGKLFVRVSYTDNLGKERELMRRARDKKHAGELKRQLVKQLDSAEGNPRAEIDAQKLTFAKVAERYEAVRLIEAQYIGDRKVCGLRSLRTPKTYLKRLVEHFGNARIRSITYSQVDQYRLKRLSEGLTIASVNRELSLLRSVFNFGKREGIISRTPFEMGAPLISACDEAKRDRVLGRGEEENLLLALSGNYPHLLPLVVASLDTGARRNELFTLTWRDVDLTSGVIRLRSVNTKTARSRELPISSRLRDELERLRATSDSADALVFNTRNWRRGFDAALRAAGVDNFRWHDMRHSFASRLAHSGLPISELAALLGHSQIQTTLRYANPTAETLQKATDILNLFNAGELNKAEEEEASPGDYIN
jgi:integrase